VNEAYRDMATLVSLSQSEVGWFGLVERQDNEFIITEVFLPKQKANAATCEISAEGIGLLTEELLKEENGADKVGKLLFWGHSHVGISVMPSQQDSTQMSDFAENGAEWFLRGIFNSKGEAKFDLFYFEIGLIILDLPWTVIDNLDIARERKWRKAIKEKVKGKHFPKAQIVSAPGMYPHYGGAYPFNQGQPMGHEDIPSPMRGIGIAKDPATIAADLLSGFEEDEFEPANRGNGNGNGNGKGKH